MFIDMEIRCITRDSYTVIKVGINYGFILNILDIRGYFIFDSS